MRRWLVITPEYSYTEIVCAEGGPTYTACDVIEIEAETRRDAIALGVMEMLKGGRTRGIIGWYDAYRWCLDQRADGLCPYTGVRAEEVDENGIPVMEDMRTPDGSYVQ